MVQTTCLCIYALRAPFSAFSCGCGRGGCIYETQGAEAAQGRSPSKWGHAGGESPRPHNRRHFTSLYFGYVPWHLRPAGMDFPTCPCRTEMSPDGGAVFRGSDVQSGRWLWLCPLTLEYWLQTPVCTSVYR